MHSVVQRSPSILWGQDALSGTQRSPSRCETVGPVLRTWGNIPAWYFTEWTHYGLIILLYTVDVSSFYCYSRYSEIFLHFCFFSYPRMELLSWTIYVFSMVIDSANVYYVKWDFYTYIDIMRVPISSSLLRKKHFIDNLFCE